jgi:opacity protein-like surface antigen
MSNMRQPGDYKMRNLILAAASVAFLASGAAAIAAEQTEGTVISVNAASGTLTLQDGQTFNFANGKQLLGILPGQTVGVSHQGAEGLGAFNPNPAND